MPVTNEIFVNKANALRPKLNETEITPVSLVEIYETDDDRKARRTEKPESVFDKILGMCDRLCFYFTA